MRVSRAVRSRSSPAAPSCTFAPLRRVPRRRRSRSRNGSWFRTQAAESGGAECRRSQWKPGPAVKAIRVPTGCWDGAHGTLRSLTIRSAPSRRASRAFRGSRHRQQGTLPTSSSVAPRAPAPRPGCEGRIDGRKRSQYRDGDAIRGSLLENAYAQKIGRDQATLLCTRRSSAWPGGVLRLHAQPIDADSGCQTNSAPSVSGEAKLRFARRSTAAASGEMLGASKLAVLRPPIATTSPRRTPERWLSEPASCTRNTVLRCSPPKKVRADDPVVERSRWRR